MANKQVAMLTEVAEKVGSALGIVAAEAAKIVRPLKMKGTKRSQKHSAPARKRRTKMNSMRRRATGRSRNARKRTSRKMSGRRA
jgi:hypothetical protein